MYVILEHFTTISNNIIYFSFLWWVHHTILNRHAMYTVSNVLRLCPATQTIQPPGPGGLDHFSIKPLDHLALGDHAFVMLNTEQHFPKISRGSLTVHASPCLNFYTHKTQDIKILTVYLFFCFWLFAWCLE